MSPITYLTATLALAISLTMASPVTSRASAVNSTTVPIAYYQGELYFSGQSSDMTTSCGMEKVFSGTFNGNVCTALTTYGIGLSEKFDQACTFQMWTGVSDCSSSGVHSMITVPKGNETTCINTGVLDGGLHYQASGIYSCP